MTDPEAKAVHALISACERVISWLDRIATHAEDRAGDRRFPSLADANKADALNYRATSSDLRKAVKKASAVVK